MDPARQHLHRQLPNTVRRISGLDREQRSGHIDFYLYNPSQEIQSHSHWTCFQHRGNDWYLVHMAKEPKDVDSGIMTIERLIKEAYET